MGSELQAALWGAFIGGVLTFLASYFLEIKKDREKKKIAVNLFKYLHSEWLAAENLDRAKASQMRDYELLLNTSDQIRQTIIESSDDKIIKSFLKYSSTLKQLHGHLLAGNLGLINWPIDEIKNLYSSFEKDNP